MDEQIVQFFFDLMNVNRESMTSLVFKSIDIHFSMDQLIDLMAPLMHIICQKIPQISLYKADTLQKRKYDLNLL